MDFEITKVLDHISINIDGAVRYYAPGELHPSTPIASGNVVYIYSTTAIYDFDRNRIVINLSNDTVEVDGVTVFATAADLAEALADIFFSVGEPPVWHKFGFNDDVDSATPEILASFGGAFDPVTDVITSDQTISISYTPASDGSTSTGTRSILFTLVREVDGVLSEVSEVHVLGSSGSDTTSFTARGINRAVVLSNGGLGRNGADIDFEIGGVIQGQIPAGTGVTQQVIFHTRQNYTFEITGFEINCLKLSGGGTPVVTIILYSWSRVTETRYEVFKQRVDTGISNELSINFGDETPLRVGGREVFYMEVSTDSNNTAITGRVYGREKRN